MNATYQLVANAPAPLAWDAYQSLVELSWTSLLNRSPCPGEREVQSFLERHPCLIPGALGVSGGPSGHYPYYCSVITQAVLPSYNHRQPDFIWLSKDSEVDHPVLIEIEDPAKQWWTDKGLPSAKLTQALDQITQWKTWFSNPANVLNFKSFYGLDREAWHGRTFRPGYVLIYGRRAEANRDAVQTAKRKQMRADDIVMMTYDRLQPDYQTRELFCIKRDGIGFSAVTVPPTITLGPSLAPYRREIKEKEVAVSIEPYMSTDRKGFLLSRLKYWDEWAASGNRGIVSTGARE